MRPQTDHRNDITSTIIGLRIGSGRWGDLVTPVSLPSAATHCAAATAAALPPEDPPGTLLKSQGLRVTCTHSS